jgi:hypothetical protein
METKDYSAKELVEMNLSEEDTEICEHGVDRMVDVCEVCTAQYKADDRANEDNGLY